MDDGAHLGLALDFGDDAVGAFEPAKALRQLERAFPDTGIDPTVHQRGRLLQELGTVPKGHAAAGRWYRNVRRPRRGRARRAIRWTPLSLAIAALVSASHSEGAPPLTPLARIRSEPDATPVNGRHGTRKSPIKGSLAAPQP